MGKLFGTDGIRGIANEYISPELTVKIGRAGAHALAGHLKRQGTAGRAPKILVGTDTRLSADMLEAALVAGLCSVGAEVYRAGVIPSPAMAFLVRHYKMDAGVMLSASHNAMEDNGIKFFDDAGYKLSDEVEAEIEALVGERAWEIPRPVGKEMGRSFSCENGIVDYVDFLAGTIDKGLSGGGSKAEGFDDERLNNEKCNNGRPFTDLKVALDCANGATYEAAPMIFRKLGAEVFPLHYKPDGININENCGSTHLESLQAYVKANHVDIGLAFDGDGDRVLCVDETGEVLDGDGIMAICGLALKKKGLLKNNTIVATVMSNLGLEWLCRKEGINLLRTAVGDRYVVQEMKAEGYNLGGEQSGHIIFHDYNTTGDGILTGLQLLATLKESGQKLSQLRSKMEIVPQVLLGAKLGGRVTEDEIKQNEKISKAIRAVELKVAGVDSSGGGNIGDGSNSSVSSCAGSNDNNNAASAGRVLIRPSGTEPLVRVMIEGRDQTAIQQWAEALVQIIEKELR